MRNLLTLVLALLVSTANAAVFNNDFTTNAFHVPGTNPAVVFVASGVPVPIATTSTNAFFMKRGVGFSFVDAGTNTAPAFGHGTPNTLAQFITTNSIGDSVYKQSADGTQFTIGTNATVANNAIQSFVIGGTDTLPGPTIEDNSKRSFVIGESTIRANSDDSIVLGFNNEVGTNSDTSIIIGQLSSIPTQIAQSIIIGDNSTVRSSVNLAIGSSILIKTNSDNAIAIGLNAGIDENANDSMAIGSGAAVYADAANAVALGPNSSAGYPNSVAIGDGASSTEAYDFRLGNSSHKVSIPGVLRLANTNEYTDNGTTLTRNGVSLGSGNVTNTYNTIITTNLTVLNALTVSNIFSTNITVQNNLVVSNLYTVNGNHNTLIVTNGIVSGNLRTNILAASSTGVITNVNYGTGITWTPSTLTISATATSETTATNIVTLTMTGTNVSAMDYSLVSRGGVFKLVLTGNGYIGAPSGVANTAFTKAWLMVQQPSTGTCLLQFTNGFYSFPEGQTPVIDTNNGAVTVYEFASDVFTNGLIHGWMSTKMKLIP